MQFNFNFEILCMGFCVCNIKIAAYYQPRFTAGIKLKEACNKKEKNKKSKK